MGPTGNNSYPEMEWLTCKMLCEEVRNRRREFSLLFIISLKVLTGDIWTNQMAIVNHVVKNVKARRNAELLNAAPRTAVGGQGELVTK